MWSLTYTLLLSPLSLSDHQIHPLGEGQIRITVHDLCLPVPDVIVVVYVATIHSIQVKVPDKVRDRGR